MKAGRPLPRRAVAPSTRNRITLPSLVVAKLAVYETMRARLVEIEACHGARVAGELGVPAAGSAPELASGNHRRSAARMKTELPIDLPKRSPRRRAA